MADPTPLGLAGFSCAVLLTSAGFAGVIPASAVADAVAPVGFLAGLSLLLGASIHLASGNPARTLAGTNFGVYGAYWTGVAVQTARSGGGDLRFITWLRVPLAAYTAVAWVAALFVNRASAVLFTALEAELVLLIAGAMAPSDALTRAGGWCGIACALSGFYASASLLLRSHVHLPLGAPPLPLRALRRTDSAAAILNADDA